MNKLLIFTILLISISTGSAQSQTFFQKITGNWEGTLEYLDYKENKRVRLKTYLTVTPASDGRSANFLTIYDDVNRVIKDNETVKVDLAAGKYFSGDFEYKIDSIEDGKIILLGSGQDGENVEPIRQTITFNENSLNFLKETRSPWQFRNQMTFKRTSENILAKRTLSPAQLKSDFDVFKSTLTAIHPGIYRYQTLQGLEKLFDEFEAKFKNPLSENEFFKLISQFTTRIYCGHTFPNPYNQDNIVRERLFNNRTYIPFYFQIIDGKIIITENASKNSLAKGSEITRINGVPAGQIIEKLLSVARADGKNTIAHRINSLELTRFEAERYALFDWYFPLFFPLNDENFTIEAVDFATGKRTKFQVPAMTKEERTAEIAKRYGPPPTYDDGWKFEIQDDSTAYLKIENSITWRLKNIKFKEFLADAFAGMRAKNIRNLIIDLRGNGGGDTDIGFELARYLAKRNLPAYIADKRLVRNVAPQPDLLKYLDTYSEELKNSLKNGVAPAIYRKAENGFFEILPNEQVTIYPPVVPYENSFQGKTYIISDSSNASAAFQFLDYAQENNLGQIVGQETGGNKQGINGGNYFFLKLPNSRIEIDIPVYYAAPLVPQRDESVIPEIPVKKQPEDIGRGFDREIAKIKELIKSN